MPEVKSLIDSGNSTFLALGIGMVTLMIVGVIVLNSGLCKKSEAMNTWCNGLVISAIAILMWGIYGYNFAFNGVGKFFGNFSNLFLGNLKGSVTEDGIPEILIAGFQLTFAVITPVIGFGGILGRIKLLPLAFITLLWLTFSYCPIAYMSWADNGFLLKLGVEDLAGGNVVHIPSGILCAVGLFFAGRRLKHRDVYAWNNSQALIGIGLLIVGWPFFNAVSVLAANGKAGMALFVSLVAAAAGMVTWVIVNLIARQKTSVIGVATAAVGALAGITPAAGVAGVPLAIGIGAACSVGAWGLMHLFNDILDLDDTVDVIPAHLAGGIIGGLMTAFAFDNWISQLGKQVVGVGTSIVWCSLVTVACFYLAKLIFRDIKICSTVQEKGTDETLHGESAQQH